MAKANKVIMEDEQYALKDIQTYAFCFVCAMPASHEPCL